MNTKQLKENTALFDKPTKIGNAKETLAYLKQSFDIDTVEQLQEAQMDCLVITRRGNTYYNESKC